MITGAPDTSALAEFANHVSGRVLLPTDADFALRATPWNVANASAPIAVVEVTGPDDVAAAIRFARARGVDVAVRATGHGALPFERPTLLVHTGLLDEVTIHEDGSARVGAGVLWGTVLEGAPLGLGGLAGSAPGIGVVGYVTGGGLGPVARTFGFASDHVTAFDVVTGDGAVRRATATKNADLFWALRGGKGALGVVTAVEMQLMPVASIYGGCSYYAADDIARVAQAWRTWSEDLPEQATTSLAILRLPPMPQVPPPLAGQVTLAVRFAWVGDPEEGAAVLEPMLSVAPTVLGGVGVMPYAALGSIHADPVDPMPAHEGGTLLRELSVEALDAVLAHAGAGVTSPQIIVELRLMGGAICSPPEHPSAVCYRDAAYSLITIGIAAPPVIEATVQDSARLMGALSSWSTGGRLPNYGASSDPRQVARAYTPETVDRLATLIGDYDPDSVLGAGTPFRALVGTSGGEGDNPA